jgi:hypothetical protein
MRRKWNPTVGSVLSRYGIGSRPSVPETPAPAPAPKPEAPKREFLAETQALERENLLFTGRGSASGAVNSTEA